MAKQVSLDATHVAYKPVQTRYGTAVTGVCVVVLAMMVLEILML